MMTNEQLAIDALNAAEHALNVLGTRSRLEFTLRSKALSEIDRALHRLTGRPLERDRKAVNNRDENRSC